ncbi:predicted protein [Naegleria gruberi]|uniref:Predicted protein n=1 Tax=Naegleria gruberi TaxID=5762 RepID=D2VYD9_NAEGR|nr:uncharacterized protein NAEGRDRAFT_74086 [Naegleria gruberi]EFC38190.1 predicted protein [Naegleria gruberi]|eukprot:XP_002670934.1 predicted protein [Naegleria gruberi strain NEG-M]
MSNCCCINFTRAATTLVSIPKCSNATGGEIIVDDISECVQYDPNTPLVPCLLVPNEFRVCDFPLTSPSASIPTCAYEEFIAQNGAFQNNTKYGYANCTVLASIECVGPRSWHQLFPCKTIYSNFQFVTALVLSVFAGIFGADRFYLQHIVLGVIKLLTLGGVGVWWIVDIGLLVAGIIVPADGSSWQQYY